MAMWRVLRCHPFAKGGLDPVVKLNAVDPPSGSVRIPSGGETKLCSH
jgi:putative component of membrane protein insertase Oxa1/YidC/SpoIIIJ protein YidD